MNKLRQFQPLSEDLHTLTEWSGALASGDVPPAIRRRATLIVLDDLGAMIAARHEPELVALRTRIASAGGPAEATMFDDERAKTDRYTAALGNGSAANWCELDGGYRPTVCHAALYVLPALLAEAEATGATTEEMMTAFVAGYETIARIARTFVFPGLTVHPHGALAAIGGAAAVARLRGRTGPQAAAAINTAATLVMPAPFQHAVDGALVRNVWPGINAQNALRAVDWEEIGITGTATGLSEVLSGILGASIKPGELTEGLGESWAVEDGYHKMHACCQYGHSTVEAITDAISAATSPPLPADVSTIRVETHQNACKLDNPRPATTLAAKFSIQHIAAATLFHSHAGAESFAARTLDEPTIGALRDKVEITAYEPAMPPPNDRPARVTITLENGTQLVGECLSAQGGKDHPFSEEQTLAKARDNIDDAYLGAADKLFALLDGNHAPDLSWRGLVAELTS